MPEDSEEALPESVEELKARLAEAEETLRAIREGEVDAVVVSGAQGEQVYSLVGAESVYRLIVETMKEAAFTVAFDGTILYANGRFGEFVKQPVEQIVGYDLRQFAAAGDRAAVEAILTQGREQPVRQRLVFTASDGTAIPAHISSNVLDVSGAPSICIVATDLTELENSTEVIASLRQQRNALRESEERFRGLSEAMPQIVWTAKATGVRDYYNLKALEYAGASLSNLTGWKWISIIHPEDRKVTLDAWRQTIATGQIYEIEHRLRRADGEFRWHLTRAVPLRNDQGALIQWIGTATDIHDRKMAEQELERRVRERTAELARSKALLESVTANAPVVLTATDAQGVFTVHTGKSVEASGRKRGELVGKNYRVALLDRPQALDGVRRALEGESFTGLLEGPPGSAFDTRFEPVRDAEGNVTGIIGVAIDITERMQAEQELGKSQTLINAIVESTSDYIWSVDPNRFGLLSFNNALRDHFLGRGVQLQVGMRPEEAFSDRTLAAHWRSIYQRTLAEGSCTEDYESTTAGAMLVTASLLKRDGKVFAISVFSKNITERKHAESELRRLNRTLRVLSSTNRALVRAQTEPDLPREICRTLVEEAGYRMAWMGYAENDDEKTLRPVAVAGVEDGYVQAANITWADTPRGQGPPGIAVRTRQPAVCSNILKAARFAPWREEAIERGYASCCSIPIVTDDKSVAVLNIYSPVADAFDAPEAKLLREVAEDLTFGLQALRTRAEHQQMEEQLRAERERLYAVLEALPPMICLLTPDYHVAFANRAFRERFGESQGRRCYDYCFGRPSPCEICETYDVLKTGQPHHWEVNNPDGSVIDAYDFPFTDADGTPMILEMDIDITTRRQAEEEVRRLNEELEQRVRLRTAQLEASNKELESFSYSVSHDLRAPLRAMDGFSRILLEEYRSQLPEKAQKYLDFVRDGASHMGNLIDGLLTLSRLGRQELQRRPVEVAEIVRQAMGDLREDLAGSAVEFIVGTLPACHADPLLLRQVFVNLLSNALKFSRKQEKVRIEIGVLRAHEAAQAPVSVLRLLVPDSWIYYVRDNGVGFDMRYADKLFGVFQRLHRQEEFKGTGIGLATVQQIVHKHDGQVWAEGEVAKGATFYFTIGPSQDLASG